MARMIAEVYRAFRAANVPEEQAEAAARAVAEAGEGLVSNETLRLELAALRQELKADIATAQAAVQSDMHTEIAKLRTEIAASEERVTRKLYALFGALAVLIAVFEFIN